MTTRLKVKVVRRAVLKLKVLPRLPANLIGSDFIKVTRDALEYTITPDYNLLSPGPILDPASSFFAILDQAAGYYKIVSVASLLTSSLDPDVQAIAALSGTGVLSRTAANTWALRTFQAPAAGLTITNPDGVSGNQTFALANDLAGVEALSSNGLAVRTAADAWAVRTMQAPAAGLTITNPGGVAGNPTFAFGNDLGALEALAGTGIARRTGTDTWSVGSAVTNAELAQVGAFTLKGNPSGSTAAPSDFTISSLTLKAAPVGADEMVIADSAAGGALKKVSVSSLPGSGGGGTVANQALMALAISEYSGAYVTTGMTFADGFKSTGMVDVAGATNLDVSEVGYLKPAQITGSFTTYLTVTTTGDTGGYSNFTIVQTIAAAQVGVTGTGVVEITFSAASAEPFFLGTPYLGHVKPSGNGYEFEATPVAMTVSGSNPIPSNGTRTATANFTIQSGKGLAIAFFCGGDSTQDGLKRRNTATTGLASWSKGGGQDSSTVAKTGYSADAPALGVTQFRFAPTSPGNLTVASQTIPIGYQPSGISGNVRVVPTDALTLNTDFILEVSRDNGVTWTAVVLALDFTDGGVSVLKFPATSVTGQPAGSLPKWRIRSANTKNFKVDGVGMDFAQ